MANSDIDVTRTLLGDLEMIAGRGANADPAENDILLRSKILAISSEISSRLAHLEERLQEGNSLSDDEALRLAALGRATAEAGHQIANLLAVLGARLDVCEICIRGEETEKALDNLGIAREQFRSAQRLVVGLIDSSDAEDRRRGRDLNEIARSSVSFVRLLAQYEHIDFDLDLAPDLRAVSIDPAQWQQLFLCLFSNAADAIGRRRGEGGRILVTTRNDEDGLDVILEVRDMGHGISNEDMVHVFEPGFTTRGPGREGIGLHICRQIAEEATGKIEIESGRPRGTTVTMRLPGREPPREE